MQVSGLDKRNTLHGYCKTLYNLRNAIFSATAPSLRLGGRIEGLLAAHLEAMENLMKTEDSHVCRATHTRMARVEENKDLTWLSQTL